MMSSFTTSSEMKQRFLFVPSDQTEIIPHALKSKVIFGFLGGILRFRINFSALFTSLFFSSFSFIVEWLQTMCETMRIDAILHGNEPSVNSFCEIDKQKKQFDRKKYLPPKCLLLLFGFTVNTQLFEM